MAHEQASDATAAADGPNERVPWLPDRATPAPTAATGWRTDARNLILIVAGWLVLLLLVPPQHAYPVLDDWIYAGSVQHQLETGAFAMPDKSQANLVGLTLWGTGWAEVLGFSYTTLTYSTLAFALLGLLAFYGLLRALQVPPAAACLGVALLALNPLFFHFSYTFMTDVPFLALVLCACYGYVRGLQGRGSAWLWLAGLAAGWGFLIRQFAVLVPLGFLLYLAVKAGRTRRLRPGAWLGVAAMPALFVLGWWLWSRDMPPSGAAAWAAGRREAFIWKEAWIAVILVRGLASLPLLALSAWTALPLRRSRYWMVAVWTAIIAWSWVAVDGPGQEILGATEPPFTFRLGPIAFDLPQQINTFIGYGNLLRVTGLDFFEYRQAGIWSPEAWRLVFVLGTIMGILLLAKLSSAWLDWLVDRDQRDQGGPLAGTYLAGLAILGASLALPSDFFDRYVLGFLPFVILFAVRGARQWGRWAWRYSVLALLVWGLFAVLLQADFGDHDNARWQAATWLLARVQPVQAGFEWGNTHGYGNGLYEVADIPIPGFRIEAGFPYTSRLSGFTTRYVYAQARGDLPPLPPPATQP